MSSEDDASDGEATVDVKPQGVMSSGASAPAAEPARQQATQVPVAAESAASTAPTQRPPPSAPPTTNAAQATLRLGSPPLGPPPGSAAPGSAAPGSAAPGSAAPGLSRLGIPLEERSCGEYRGLGFTSVVRHLSLRGWLRWIQSNQCDATLRVRTRDGGSGCIWCSTGKVVDAEWNTTAAAAQRATTFSGEQALMELLRLESGSVSIDFDPVDRPRRIARATLPLEDPPLEDPPLGGLSLGALSLEELRLEELRLADVPPPSGAPPSGAPPSGTPPSGTPPSAPSRARRLSRSEYFTGGILLGVFVLVAFAVGRQRAASEDAQGMVVEPRRAQETQALLPPSPLQKLPPGAASSAAEPKDLSLIRFATLEVEPARAEIWLDHSLLGLGRVELAPLLDGELHELRFVAAGHASRSLYFVRVPPSGRVVLEQADVGASPAASPGGSVEPEVAGVSAPEPAAPQRAEAAHGAASPRAEPVPRAAVRAPRRRSAPIAAATAGNPSSSPAASARGEAGPSAKSPTKKAPQIQLIDAQMPRVKVLD